MASNAPVIGNYRLAKELASGAFGRVFLAEHLYLTNRVVAIKLLHAHLFSQKERDGFLQEARILEMLKHQYILPVIDVGLHEGIAYMVTEFAQGGSLRGRMAGQPMSPEEATRILTQIAEALQHAHERQIIHRDLKPENVLFHADGRALLADFGVSTVLTTMSMQSGTVIGTPSYMAPEQFQGKAGKESDQYALACIAYELFTGQRVFTAPDMFALGMKHLTEQPLPPAQVNANVPAHISQAILKALAKDRTQRYGGVMDFIQAVSVVEKAADYIAKGNKLQDAKRYHDALSAYEQALRLDPQSALAYYNKGTALWYLKRFEEALAACEQALRLDPQYALAYYVKGYTLWYLKHFEEALTAYEQALRLDPQYALAYNGKGNALHDLKRFDEALAAYEQALHLNPQYALAYNGKGAALWGLKRFDEALAAHEQAVHLDPQFALAHYNRGLLLQELKRDKEAQQAFERAKQLGFPG